MTTPLPAPRVAALTVKAFNGNVWISVLIDGTTRPLLELTTREADKLAEQIHETVTLILSGRANG